jgi:hypothetical protein
VMSYNVRCSLLLWPVSLCVETNEHTHSQTRTPVRGRQHTRFFFWRRTPRRLARLYLSLVLHCSRFTSKCIIHTWLYTSRRRSAHTPASATFTRTHALPPGTRPALHSGAPLISSVRTCHPRSSRAIVITQNFEF